MSSTSFDARRMGAPESVEAERAESSAPTRGRFYRVRHQEAEDTIFAHKLLSRTLFMLTVRSFMGTHPRMRYQYSSYYNSLADDLLDEYLNTESFRYSLVTHEENAQLAAAPPPTDTAALLRHHLEQPVWWTYKTVARPIFCTAPGQQEAPDAVGAHVEAGRKIVGHIRRSDPDWRILSSDAQVKYIARQLTLAFAKTDDERLQRLREVERRILIDTRGQKTKLDARYLPIDDGQGRFVVDQHQKAFLLERDRSWRIWIDETAGATSTTTHTGDR